MRLAGLRAGLVAALRFLEAFTGLVANLPLAGRLAVLLGRLAGLLGLVGLAAFRLTGLTGLTGLAGVATATAPLRLAAFRLAGKLVWLWRRRVLLFRLPFLLSRPRLLSRVCSGELTALRLSSSCLTAFLGLDLVATASVLDFEGLGDKGGGFGVRLRVCVEVVASADDLRFLLAVCVSVCEVD